MKALTFIHNIFKKYPRLLIMTTALVIVVSIFEACSLLTVGPLVDFLIHPDLANVSSLTVHVVKVMKFFGIALVLRNYLIVFIGFVILSSIFRILAWYSILRTKITVLRDLTLGTFDDFFHTRWHFFSSSGQGTLLNTFTRELNIVGSAFATMAYFFANILQLILYLAIPIYLSWQVTLISLATALLLSVPFMLIGRLNYELGKLATATSNKVSSVIQENFSLAKVVLGFARQKRSTKDLSLAFDAHQGLTLKAETINNSIPVLYRPLAVIVLAVALFSARRFDLPVSETAVLLLALLQVVIAIGNLTAKKNMLDNFFPSYEQIKILRHKAKESRQTTEGRIFSGFNKEISLTNVSFTYPGGECALKDINIRIPKGRMVAFVGRSGAGKSTLIDMIMGFNEVTAGRIAFDDNDIREFNINSCRERIGYVPQDSVLFNMSIMDNLLWAKEDAAEEEIRHACRLANADEFIEGFPMGYDTVVGDRGVRLSGGQCQRVALARAILRKPELLILDEATSSLDTQSERLIQKAIENIAKETTVIVIAHRLSTIVNADYVYVLEDGRVIEEGRYSDLVKTDGHFNRMVKLQLL